MAPICHVRRHLRDSQGSYLFGIAMSTMRLTRVCMKSAPSMGGGLFQSAVRVLRTESPMGKVGILCDMKRRLLQGERFETDCVQKPFLLGDYTARPSAPRLVCLKDMPSRKKLGVREEIYLLHSLAHIEMNAMDMYT